MIAKPYLIFLGDAENATFAKTGLGVRAWAPDDCLGQWRLSDATVDLGLPDMRPAEAFAAGARSLLIGVASIGGQMPAAWTPLLVEALEAGLDIVSGMHTKLANEPEIAKVAASLGRALHDVRQTDRPLSVATGKKRSGKRLLTVGTDCALGKKYTALAITRAMRAQGIDADFRATGQTGVMISGDGLAIDSVVADFIAGAAELLSPAANADHWDVVEGQGAIFHPAYSGVTLGLLHGSQPDALVLCHDPSRTEINGFPGFPIRPLDETMAVYVTLARITNPAAEFVGIALNTSSFPEAQAKELAADLEQQFGLPCFDPMRFGVDAAVARIVRKEAAAA